MAKNLNLININHFYGFSNSSVSRITFCNYWFSFILLINDSCFYECLILNFIVDISLLIQIFTDFLIRVGYFVISYYY